MATVLSELSLNTVQCTCFLPKAQAGILVALGRQVTLASLSERGLIGQGSSEPVSEPNS